MATRVSLSFPFRAIFSLAVFASLAISARATVTPVAWWRMGENDPGTVTNGATATATTNLLGGVMNFAGGPTYTTNVSSAAASADGSTLALKFPGSNSYGTNALFANLTNNFGLELWVNPAANSANACLAYNGNSGGDGWGLYILGGQFKGLFGLVESFGSAPATLNTWTHLALVRNNGTNTVYVNGVANVINTATPNLPSGIFAVGAQAQSLTTEFLNGALDEVRVFTFAPGSFTTNDLLLNQSLVVSTNADGGPGSLRTVVANAPAGATLTFAPNLSGQTILLTNGQITLAQNVTIDGSALASPVLLNGKAQSRIFYVNTGVSATLNSLVITNGYDASANGGGIYTLGSLTMNHCTFANNIANGSEGGSGICMDAGTLTVNNCTFTNNRVISNGSGAIFASSGVVILNNSTLANNSATNGDGGGIFNYSTLTVNNCTLINNNSLDGGGIFNIGTLTVNNSTFANNSSSLFGGGIFNGGALTVNNSTLAYNIANVDEGGIYINGGVANLTNSIVSLNTGGNIYGSYSSSSNLVGVANINLAPLGYYGGPTMTMPPLPGSPAIDAGNDAAASQFTTDQRGFPRKVGAHVDIGAVESGTPIPGYNYNLVTITNDYLNDGVGGVSLRTAVANFTNNATITFAPTLSGQTILLTNGQITLAQNVTIDGSALASPVQLNGNAQSRILYVNSGVTAALSSLVITNGKVLSSDYGGGIYNSGGTLTVNNCTIANNGGGFAGGGIYSFGALSVNNCTLAYNSSNSRGGGILNDIGGTLSVDNCSFASNSADLGGGIYNGGILTANNCTLVKNSAGLGGGVYFYTGSAYVTNSIVCLNGGGDISGSYSGSSNLGGIANINLASLGNYGGPTMTMPPLPGSPAIDAGNDAVTGFLATDQRGFPRKTGAHVDIGAVEVQVASAGNPPLLGNAAWSATGGGGGTFQFNFTNTAAADFTVLTATNVALPLASWKTLGNASQPLPGQYQFTDAAATNGPQQFYRVVSP